MNFSIFSCLKVDTERELSKIRTVLLVWNNETIESTWKDVQSEFLLFLENFNPVGSVGNFCRISQTAEQIQWILDML